MAKLNKVVVLVHGLAANRLMMKPIEMHLRRQGFDTLNWGYPSIFGGIESHSRRLSKILRRFDDRPDVDSIGLVTHSMGSIVARAALLETRPEKVRQLVMLGPPNRGSRVATILAHGLGWLCKPLSQLSDTHDSFVNQLPPTDNVTIGVIAARHDRVVAIDSTHLSTEHEHLVVTSGHSSMLFRCDVANFVANFLRAENFETSSREGNSVTCAANSRNASATMLTSTAAGESSRILTSPSSR